VIADKLSCLVESPVSVSKISSNAADKAALTNGEVITSLSMHKGLLEEADTPMAEANGDVLKGAGLAKRKVRESLAKPSYAEAESSDDDDQPLVYPSVEPRREETATDSPVEQETEEVDEAIRGCCCIRLR